MKRLIGSSLAVLALSFAANATVIIDEPFNYSDGQLVGNGDWFTHSGTTGQVDVVSGVVNLTFAEGEDVSKPLGASYTTEDLYGSFKVNFSALPGSGEAYFAHFRNNSTTFRCKIFSTTAGAETGKFRLGIANSANSGAAYIATDLDLNTEYKLVFRFQGSTNSTLWINPTSESSVANRADATDATTLGSYYSTNYCLRQASGIGTMTVDDLLIGTQFSDVQTVGGPPSITGLVSTNIAANSNTGPMPFIVMDVETPAASLTVGATSDNPTLVPNNPANLTFGGSGENRTLTVTPAASEEGTANIQVVVTDGNSETATNTFTLMVGVPTISAIDDQTVLDGSIKTVSFWVNDNETAPGSLIVTATSFDQNVLPDYNIGIVNSGGTNRTLHLTNTMAGATTVTVTVSDGTFNVPTDFTLTVSPDNGILLAEDFSYPDGSFITNSSFAWSPNTGTTGQTQVASGKLLLTNTGSEDLYKWYTNAAAPFADTSGQVIFTRFVVNFSELPTASGTGQYFNHTYAFSGAYKARVYSTTNGATSGKFRLSISNGGSTPQTFPEDLSLGKSYVVITRYNTATSESTLWINPTNVNSTSVSGIDSTGTTTTYGVSFRQSTGIGSMSIDDLLVGSQFSQVLLILPPQEPTPEPIITQQSGGNLIMSWTDPAFKLATGTNINGITNVISTMSPYTNSSMSDPQRYFRLVYP